MAREARRASTRARTEAGARVRHQRRAPVTRGDDAGAVIGRRAVAMSVSGADMVLARSEFSAGFGVAG